MHPALHSWREELPLYGYSHIWVELRCFRSLLRHGWLYWGGADFIERSMLACALDRLPLLSAGSAPKVGALFAPAELNRNICAQLDPILTATSKYHLL
jgi:hypothetical protein